MDDRIIDRLTKIKSMITFLRSILSTQEGEELHLQGESLEGLVEFLREIEQIAETLGPIYLKNSSIQQIQPPVSLKDS